MLLHYVGPDAFTLHEDDIVIGGVQDGSVSQVIVDGATTIAAASDAGRALHTVSATGTVTAADAESATSPCHRFEYDFAARHVVKPTRSA